jgi:hypothetical protein
MSDKAYYQKNKERLKAKAKARYEANKDLIKKQTMDRYYSNHEENKAKMRARMSPNAYERVCLTCDKEFKAKGNRALYCSISCKSKAQYNRSDKAKLNKKKREHYEKNKTKYKELKKVYYQDNKERHRKWRDNWVYENLDKHRDNCSKAEAERNKDPIYNMKCRLRRRIIHVFERNGWKKDMRTLEYIGCSPKELKEHLENQFKEGMNWDNRGEWHIDHIIPLSSAKTKEELIKLNHYSNLQPLWAKENLCKGAKLELIK